MDEPIHFCQRSSSFANVRMHWDSTLVMGKCWDALGFYAGHGQMLGCIGILRWSWANVRMHWDSTLVMGKCSDALGFYALHCLYICEDTIIEMFFDFYAPGSNDQGHIFFVLSICLSVCCQL